MSSLAFHTNQNPTRMVAKVDQQLEQLVRLRHVLDPSIVPTRTSSLSTSATRRAGTNWVSAVIVVPSEQVFSAARCFSQKSVCAMLDYRAWPRQRGICIPRARLGLVALTPGELSDACRPHRVSLVPLGDSCTRRLIPRGSASQGRRLLEAPDRGKPWRQRDGRDGMRAAGAACRADVAAAGGAE